MERKAYQPVISQIVRGGKSSEREQNKISRFVRNDMGGQVLDYANES
jgi:hypothetical protein